jgi:hypothetical protein
VKDLYLEHDRSLIDDNAMSIDCAFKRQLNLLFLLSLAHVYDLLCEEMCIVKDGFFSRLNLRLQTESDHHQKSL